MKVELYDYQRDALRKLKKGSILNGGVGSGKSRTSLAYYWEKCGGDLNDILKGTTVNKTLVIITTARKRDSAEWDFELSNFAMNTADPKRQVFIDSWNNIHKFEDYSDAFFIFDEQRVVGNGAWVKSFIVIAKHNDWILLSATPGDTWLDYIPVFVANGFYKNRTDFIRQHVVFKRFVKYPLVDRYFDTGRLVLMRNSILVDMDFKRETVQERRIIDCEYDKDKYKAIWKLRRNPDTGKPFKSAGELCLALRRVVNSDSSRGAHILEILESHRRIIVFYCFDYERDILLNLGYPPSDSFAVAEWSGHKHEELPETDSWVYLVQYTAGAEGWNCIRTDTIVFYSMQYSYKILQQAMGRIDRLNTPYTTLYYYHLRSRAGIDISIGKALSEKRQFNEKKFVGSQ